MYCFATKRKCCSQFYNFAETKPSFKCLFQSSVQEPLIYFIFILQKLRSLTTLAAIGITLLFAWKMLRAHQEQPRRPRRSAATSPSNTSRRSRPGLGAMASTDACTSSADSSAHDAINQLFQPANVMFIFSFDEH
jgi:hypothetical protein